MIADADIAAVVVTVDVADLSSKSKIGPCHKIYDSNTFSPFVNSLLRNLFLMFGNRLIFIPIALCICVCVFFFLFCFCFCFKTWLKFYWWIFDLWCCCFFFFLIRFHSNEPSSKQCFIPAVNWLKITLKKLPHRVYMIENETGVERIMKRYLIIKSLLYIELSVYIVLSIWNGLVFFFFFILFQCCCVLVCLVWG